MKQRICAIALGVSTLCAPAMFGQRWEMGVGAGGSIYQDKTLTNGSASASAGFESGLSVHAWVGQNMKSHLGGEIRYTYEKNDLKLTSGGTKASFSGASHSIFYDFLFYGNGLKSKIRPYVLAGAGVKIYQGTGKETVTQPLSNVALLTKTTGTEALVAVGGGVKFSVGGRGTFRLEFADYLTPFPKKVITPLSGTKGDGWISNFVPMVGIAYTF